VRLKYLYWVISFTTSQYSKSGIDLFVADQSAIFPSLGGLVPEPNGDNYCIALKMNMGRSAHGNLVQWVNLQNRRRAGHSCNNYPFYVISPSVAGCGSRLCTNNTSNWLVLYQILLVFPCSTSTRSRTAWCVENMFHKNGMITTNGTLRV